MCIGTAARDIEGEEMTGTTSPGGQQLRTAPRAQRRDDRRLPSPARRRVDITAITRISRQRSSVRRKRGKDTKEEAASSPTTRTAEEGRKNAAVVRPGDAAQAGGAVPVGCGVCEMAVANGALRQYRRAETFEQKFSPPGTPTEGPPRTPTANPKVTEGNRTGTDAEDRNSRAASQGAR